MNNKKYIEGNVFKKLVKKAAIFLPFERSNNFIAEKQNTSGKRLETRDEEFGC